MNKGVWFGLIIMAGVVVLTVPAAAAVADHPGHLGLLMLSLIVVAIMLGFPTAFTLMGMGIMFAFARTRCRASPTLRQTLDLFVQRAYAVMTNDVLISIPLFVFMGYLVERANLIEKLFRVAAPRARAHPGLARGGDAGHLRGVRDRTGIVGAVVTLMGLLAFRRCCARATT
jgi:TRAP-type mannitol/chloroaromatic compound transport system permease large subunit